MCCSRSRRHSGFVTAMFGCRNTQNTCHGDLECSRLTAMFLPAKRSARQPPFLLDFTAKLKSIVTSLEPSFEKSSFVYLLRVFAPIHCLLLDPVHSFQVPPRFKERRQEKGVQTYTLPSTASGLLSAYALMHITRADARHSCLAYRTLCFHSCVHCWNFVLYGCTFASPLAYVGPLPVC